MKEFLKKLYNSLKEELEVIVDFGTLPVRRLAAALTALGEALITIKAYLKNSPFKSENEEIDFFKHEKPLFVSEQLYAIEIFTIETNRPIGDIAALKTYYELELAVIKRFFNQYQFLYQYFIHELKELDSLLFIRGQTPSNIILPENGGTDPEFSTACDSLFAKFMAYERLREYIMGELESLDNLTGVILPAANGKFVELIWTGESINLVEVAYGIWLTGQINNGNATITEIIQWLEVHLQVKIGRAYRRWQSISRRKRVATTKYIDEIREALLKRLDDENVV
jgi:hypothetical protein